MYLRKNNVILLHFIHTIIYTTFCNNLLMPRKIYSRIKKHAGGSDFYRSKGFKMLCVPLPRKYHKVLEELGRIYHYKKNYLAGKMLTTILQTSLKKHRKIVDMFRSLE